MTTQLATRNDNALAVTDLPPEKVDLLKRTFCAGTSDDEFELFLYACKRTGLDPFMRQIHAVMRNDKRQGRRVMTIQTAIDGYRLIADRTGKYAGNDDAQFAAAGEGGNPKYPAAARVTVWKMVEGQRCPFTATARWSEYYPGEGDGGFMWRKMPHVMLAKVAEALALRKAFPAELSGIYTREEMDQAGPGDDAPPPQQRQSQTIVQRDPIGAVDPASINPAPKLATPDEVRDPQGWCRLYVEDADAFMGWDEATARAVLKKRLGGQKFADTTPRWREELLNLVRTRNIDADGNKVDAAQAA